MAKGMSGATVAACDHMLADCLRHGGEVCPTALRCLDRDGRLREQPDPKPKDIAHLVGARFLGDAELQGGSRSLRGSLAIDQFFPLRIILSENRFPLFGMMRSVKS